MKLDFLFKKEKKKEYFLSLLIRDEEIEAVIFEEESGKIQLIGEGKSDFKDTVENLDEEEFLDTCDKAVSEAETKIPPSIEVQKTIFGLKENWVTDDKIKKEYLEKLKKLSEALGLTPVGFLITHDAISHMLSEEEGAPVSALLIEVGIKNLAISLLRAGKIIETQRTKIEDSAAKTTDKLLQSFNYEVLPSRIIIFDGNNTEDLSQEFITHSWTKSLPFLHMPQSTVLAKGFDAKAIVFGVAKQMGFDTNTSIKIEKNESEEKKIEEKTKVQKNDEEKEEPEQTEMPEQSQETEEENIDNFGFLLNEDVAKKEMPLKEKNTFAHTQPIIKDLEINQTKLIKTEIEKKENFLKLIKRFSFIFKILTKIIFSIFMLLPKMLSKRKASLSPAKTINKLILIPPILILLTIGVFVFYIFNLKANVAISVNPKVIEGNYDLVFSTKEASKDKILAKDISVSEEGKISTPATGKKEVGEKAKGTVTIYNKSSEAKTFPPGTVVKSSNGLEYGLNDSVTIASASGDIFSPTTPGTAKGNITALDIGKEYNLPSGTTFSIGALSNVAAKNDSAFSGGSKKEINVISKNDYDKLLTDLPKKLADKAKEDVAKKASSSEDILSVILDQNFEKKSFNKEVGEEAQSLTLNANVSYHYISYNRTDLEKYLKDLLKEKDDKMEFAQKGIKYDVISFDKKDSSSIAVKIKAKAPFIPQIDKDSLIKQISGKSLEKTEEILSSVSGYSSTEVSFSPNFPFVPKNLPRVTKNITITLRTNE